MSPGLRFELSGTVPSSQALTRIELNSDHAAILLSLSKHIVEKEEVPTLSNKFTDWEFFKHNLKRRITLNVSLKTEDELDLENDI